MYEKFKPFKDNVLLKINKPQEKTESGIYLTSSPDLSPSGTIVSVSKNLTVDHTDLEIGSVVYFKKHMAIELDKEYVVVHERDILGVMHV
jgi:co-chaperonin GroES (HSP10)